MADDRRPDLPDRYRVLGEVSADDEKHVLRAHDTVLEREVWIELPGPGLAEAFVDGDERRAALDEARALARIEGDAASTTACRSPASRSPSGRAAARRSAACRPASSTTPRGAGASGRRSPPPNSTRAGGPTRARTCRRSSPGRWRAASRRSPRRATPTAPRSSSASATPTTADNIRDAVHALVSGAGPEDRLFIYYAGHGKTANAANTNGWIVPAGAEPEKPSTWVEFDVLFRAFENTAAKHVLVALDCCHGGALVGMRSEGRTSYEEHFLTRRAHVVMTSGTGHEEVSDGLPGKHSPFARSLLAHLSGDRPVTAAHLYANIQADLAAWGVSHRPLIGHPGETATGGEFVFFPAAD